ncbi:MAG: 16S rRNA (adenine(1518)-N(6)/adenine(1519)-N(6))-dimethyltransferase RsmA [Pseudomonadota bacterium]
MSHRPRKRFGQNFLHDRHVIGRIAAAIDPQPTDRIVEIGPGQGALTRELVGRCDLALIEIDRDLAAALRAEPGFADVPVIQEDVLNVDLETLGENLRLVGNLPYNISSPIIFWALAAADRVRDMHFMLQKEVVDRLAAAPGSKTFGRLSVTVQYRCEVVPILKVRPGAFFPPPKVDSAVVRLIPRPPSREAVKPERLEQVVRQAFAQRRKTLGNALRGVLDRDLIAACDVDPGARAETLSVDDFVRLANALPAG